MMYESEIGVLEQPRSSYGTGGEKPTTNPGASYEYANQEIGIETVSFDEGLKVFVVQHDQTDSQERLRVVEKHPEVAFAAGKVAEVLERVGGFWCFIGSYAYQVETQSQVSRPGDIDAIFDIENSEKVFEAFWQLQDGGLVRGLDPRLKYDEITGSSVIRGCMVTSGGGEVEFEIFGQEMGNPENQKAYINVGAGATEYEVQRYRSKQWTVAQNTLGKVGQAELYLNRFGIEFMHDLDALGDSPGLKLKTAERLFKVERLLGGLSGEDFQTVLSRVARGLGGNAREKLVDELRTTFVRFKSLNKSNAEVNQAARLNSLMRIADIPIGQHEDPRDHFEFTLERLADQAREHTSEVGDMLRGSRAEVKKLVDIHNDKGFIDGSHQPLLQDQLESTAKNFVRIEDLEYEYTALKRGLGPEDFALYVIIDRALNKFILPMKTILIADNMSLTKIEVIMAKKKEEEEPITAEVLKRAREVIQQEGGDGATEQAAKRMRVQKQK